MITNDQLFDVLPASLRRELLDAYQKIINNYIEHRWEPTELNGGKLCEVVYTILRGHLDGSYPTHASKPSNIVDACRGLEQAPNTFPRSVRIQIPRMLISLYEIRNNRGVGHVGGDVNPNHMDATCVVYMSKWIMAELVRVLHNIDTKDATEIVDSIVDRIIPIVWEVDGRKRILDTSLTWKEKTLLLLYTTSSPLSESPLLDWVEHPKSADFRKDVLRPLHKQRFIEYDAEKDRIQISPMGIEYVEGKILPNYLFC